MGDIFRDFFERVERGRDGTDAQGTTTLASSASSDLLTRRASRLGTQPLEGKEEDKDSSSSSTTERVSSPVPPPLGSSGNLGVSGPTLPEDDEGGSFAIVLGQDRVILTDVGSPNDDGWTPLHACCHSLVSVEAACVLIDEIVRANGNLNCKTTNGPGAYNSGWTPLQMACAYGLDVIVAKLLSTGDDKSFSFPPLELNCTTSLGVTPLLESCYRGHHAILKSLVAATGSPPLSNADIEYLPPLQDRRNLNPFARPPSQRPLGECARGGFVSLASTLLDAGANVNNQNHSGWTALHEACRCGHRDIVALLLDHGADAALRTKPDEDGQPGLLPWQVCCLRSLRELLEETFGNKCRPSDEEERERLKRMETLAFGAFGGGGTFVFRFGQNDDEDDDEDDEDDGGAAEEDENSLGVRWGGIGGDALALRALPASENGGADVKPTAASPVTVPDDDDDDDDAVVANNMPSSESKEVAALTSADAEAKASSSTSFPVGTISSASSAKSPTKSPSSLLGDLPSLTPGKQANYKDPTKSSRAKAKKAPVPFTADEERLAPPQFRCEVSRKLLSRPVRTQRGHVFEEAIIQAWFEKQGSICPISGEPLSERELERAEDIRRDIKLWRETLRGESSGGGGGEAKKASANDATNDDDVYRF